VDKRERERERESESESERERDREREIETDKDSERTREERKRRRCRREWGEAPRTHEIERAGERGRETESCTYMGKGDCYTER
jgi:hypothetical protein